ncbi:MAG TPA: right-handed parallel beta-helix repeat-containing protein, partial [Candidatus Micrarchaeota archaeon]|nr:right-handed parallel beta-helix repeat-containing protein [Candidatus Micrarchaeota archaeon]
MRINNFSADGIEFYASNYNAIANSSSNGSGVYGLYIPSNSLNNVVADSNLTESGNYDARFGLDSVAVCSNTLSNLLGSGYRPIFYYSGASSGSASGQDSSEILICNSTGVSISDSSVHGSDTYSNNGVQIYYSKNIAFSNVNSTFNRVGYDVTSSSGVTVSGASVPYTVSNAPGYAINGAFIVNRTNNSAFSAVSVYSNFTGTSCDTGGASFYFEQARNNSVSGYDLAARGVDTCGAWPSTGRAFDFYLINSPNITIANGTGTAYAGGSSSCYAIQKIYDYGIYASSSPNLAVYNSTFSNMSATGCVASYPYSVVGIYLASGSDNSTITGSAVLASQQNGLVLQSSGNTLDGFATANNGNSGIVLSSSSGNLINNTISSNNSPSGIEFVSNSLNNAVLNSAFSENAVYDVNLLVTNINKCSNQISNTTGSGGRAIVYLSG